MHFCDRRKMLIAQRGFAMRAAALILVFALAGIGAFSETAQGQPGKTAVNVHPGEIKLDATFGVGAWIWDAQTHDQQLCRLWRGFEIPAGAKVVNARLRITADNSYSLFLDGRELGRGADWRDLTEYDLTLLLQPGSHVLAVEAFNVSSEAGILAGLHVDLADGRTIERASDQSWKVVPNAESRWVKRTSARVNWPPATLVAIRGVREHWNLRIVKAPRLYPIVLQFWQTGWFQIALLSLFAIVAALCVWLIGRLALHSQTQQVVRRERARIARDIHDDLTAGLTQLVLLGEVAQSELPAGSEIRQQVGQVCEKARGLSRSMNEIIWAVNSQRDTLRDFVSYVCKYTETFLQPTHIRCRFDLEEETPDIPCDLGVRRNLFLAVKETLHNAVRHSHATEVVLRMRHRGAQVFVSVEDNGQGFDPAQADGARNGLSNMMKRANESGGSCMVISRPGAGCRVEFAAPLAGRAPRPFLRLNWFWKRPDSATVPPRRIGAQPDHRKESAL
jgi:signal transduction histidine kinase